MAISDAVSIRRADFWRLEPVEEDGTVTELTFQSAGRIFGVWNELRSR